MSNKAGLKAKLMVPESIDFIPVIDRFGFTELPERIEIAEATIGFKAWLSPAEFITGTAWLSDREINQIIKILDRALEKRRKSIANDVIDEAGIFDLSYFVKGQDW